MGKICLNADFSFSLSLLHPTNRLENICVLLFALLQISSQEKYYSWVGKILEGHLPPYNPPTLKACNKALLEKLKFLHLSRNSLQFMEHKCS